MTARLLPFALILAACASSTTRSATDAALVDVDADAPPDVAADVVTSDALDAPADTTRDALADATSDAPTDLAPADAPHDAPPDLDPCGGLTLCDGVCRDTAFDAHHCGACGRACAAAEECVRGACVMAPCVAPSVACGGACVDPQTDPRNCGSCGCACPSGSFCAAGNCVVGCGSGFTLCGRVTCGGDDAGVSFGCFNLSTDRANCGLCGHACPMDQFCQAGACRAP
ncbi:MAG: hypothetical protein U0324_20085 [Polyangiales bacterium]